jgi:hypothetical protein
MPRPVRLPLLQPRDGGVGVFRSAGSDVGQAAHHVIEQQATGLIGQPKQFHTALGE